MEWDLQDLGWESSTDLELDPVQDDDHNLVLLDFTNSTTLQKSTEHNTAVPDYEPNPVSARASPSSGRPSKRLIGAGGRASCLVDGCNADLSGCRDYHKRHRVCEEHSKTPIVIVKGEEKRFCQQCSRFHSLAEFDEVKRSCRKRLDGHNRRRRKSQPEPLYFTSKNFLHGYKGPRILQFGNPQLYATASVRTLWPLETKTGSESWLYSPHKRSQVTNGNQPNNTDQFLFHSPGRGRVMTTPSSSDEEIYPLMGSSGRALYLLSTNPMPISETCSFQLLDYNPKDKAVHDPIPTSYYNTANNNDSFLEHGALQTLPITLE